jgi:insulysin
MAARRLLSCNSKGGGGPVSDDVLTPSLLCSLPSSVPRCHSSSLADGAPPTETARVSLNDHIVNFNGVDKSLFDSREYLPFTLPNGLRCLAISDPQSSQSAAAVNVHVGSLSDPENIPGLAHFVEHLLFLGTTKFPQENDFSEYLSAHGGSSNAYTASEDTMYYYTVNAEAFDLALEKFSWFFKKKGPLFADSSISRELNAVENEHSKNIQNDARRIYQVGLRWT